ncbi:MAG TPA: hypothetical protein VI958_00950, partial [Acidobacteriota bacterium]
VAEKQIGIRFRGPLKVFLYNNWEEKGNQIKDIRVASVKDGALHCIVNEDFDGLREGLHYKILLEQRYGPAGVSEWSDYSASALAGVWNQKSLDDWAQFLSVRDLQPQFSYFSKEDTGASEYLLHPWNALLARFIHKTYGWDAFVRLYKDGKTPSGYQQSWNQSLAAWKSAAATPAKQFQPQFQKGMTYAYTNSYDSGYATKKSKQSLSDLKQIGVQWIAAVPYGFMRDHDSPRIFSAGHNIFTESDESMVALAQYAEESGLKIMVKPQIWIDHESWPGRVQFDQESGWREWFNNYEKWILHYAILSELINADLFCIGTELVQATINHPDRWRQLISRIRKVYHGPLVYAANYGREFEQIEFWDALDYIGLDNYYPVRSSLRDGEAEIRSAFQKQKALLKSIATRYDKPLIFTEVGYMANEGAGMGSQENQFKKYDETMQALCYTLALESYWGEPWFYGMYWWKWFSDPGDSGKEADRHSPRGRPAELIVK